jgi:5'-deoxynucleotidase YfbR-like HD superfamily hydrolase
MPQPDNTNPDNTNPDIPPDLRKGMEKKANEQRQAELKRDTERLLKLSTELKEYVDKSNEHVLSLNVIKKADEIERLAHNVKQKMRGDN